MLLAFLLLAWVPSAALSWLSFSRTRSAMTAQIERSLAAQAGTLQTDIDTMLFERFQNALVWSRSELMQDLALGDVDKRVSNYLVGLQRGYGEVYTSLDCQRDDGQVLASASAQRIGRQAAPLSPEQLSVQARLPGGFAQLYLAAPTNDGRAELVIDTPVTQAYAQPGAAAMQMRLNFDPRQIDRLLDTAAAGRREIVVVDAQGRWVAASAGLRGSDWPSAAGRQWARQAAASSEAQLQLPQGAMLAGRSHSQARPGFAGTGWTTLVLEPLDAALQPVVEMAWIFVGLLLAVLLAALVASTWIASAIARPIALLTARTQRRTAAPDEAPVRSRIAELDTLGRAYADMTRQLDSSRQELVRTSKMAMLGELAAVLGHEVRTPLGILRSSAQVLKRDPQLGDEARELMGFIDSETQRLNTLVTTLLDTARPRLPHFARCDLHALLQRCVQMHALKQADSAQAKVTLSLLATQAEIEADEEQLMQAVFNLLSNAAQAADADGRVLLSTADDGDGVTLSCGDDGPGIPPALAERIFDPFVSGREGGIGLGLAVVRQVVHAHRGSMVVGTSTLGGAAFTLRLPRVRAALPGDLA
ncbi:hypothetical protein GCM10009107_01640 [Ideonella azotifigens]|uniref:histidine kinase n=1 Tax=Ideonella azotifigens TaxID=513160 RepID=A0ABP3UPV2_9BURK